MESKSSKLWYTHLAWRIHTKTLAQKALLFYLANTADKDGRSHHSHAKIEHYGNISPASQYRAQKYLKKRGILEWVQGSSVSKKANDYKLNLRRMRQIVDEQQGAGETLSQREMDPLTMIDTPSHSERSTLSPREVSTSHSDSPSNPRSIPTRTPIRTPEGTSANAHLSAPVSEDRKEPSIPTKANEHTHAEIAGLPALHASADEFMDVPSDMAWTSFKEQVIPN